MVVICQMLVERLPEKGAEMIAFLKDFVAGFRDFDHGDGWMITKQFLCGAVADHLIVS